MESDLPTSSLSLTPVKEVFSRKVIIAVALVSVAYFADIFIRSTGKLFWYDELFTVYLCRLPTFARTWAAILHGVDFNPPLFYLLTRFSQTLFGHGLIATRLPETVGTWLFCVSLFVFISRRLGVAAGAIAGLFPFFSLASYYAYEARPHGIVVGFCGLALLCWQQTTTSRRAYLCSFGLFLSLLAAMLCHVYAVFLIVPFVAVELLLAALSRKPNWPVLAASVLPLLPVLPVYLPMMRGYHSLIPLSGVFSAGAFLATAKSIADSQIGSAIEVLFLALVCIGMQSFGSLQGSAIDRDLKASPVVPRREFWLAIFFACLPFLGLSAIAYTQGIFYDRYFLSSIAGWSILVAIATSSRRVRSWAPAALAASMLLLMLGDLAVAALHLRGHSTFGLVEPSSKFLFSNDYAKPMTRHAALDTASVSEDIFLLREIDYLYLFTYASPSVAAHLYDGAVNTETPTYKGYRLLASETHQPFKMSLLQPFLNTHDRFLVYGSDGGRFLPVCGDCIDVIQKAGFLLTSETKDADGVLYAYERQHHPASQPGPEQNQAIHSRALTSLLLAWPRTIRVTARPHGYSAARRPVRLDPPSASGADSPLYFPT